VTGSDGNSHIIFPSSWTWLVLLVESSAASVGTATESNVASGSLPWRAATLWSRVTASVRTATELNAASCSLS
jgi:hypothetical protein